MGDSTARWGARGNSRVDHERRKKQDWVAKPTPYGHMDVCALGDVDDAEAFVKSCIRKAGLVWLERDEYEELAAEGLVILCDLYNRYDPSKETNPDKASFHGYAWFLLPRKLLDAWHKMHPEHVLKTFKENAVDEETGEDVVVTTRKYVYYESACSLDERIERFEDPDDYELDRYRQCGNFTDLPIPERT